MSCGAKSPFIFNMESIRCEVKILLYFFIYIYVFFFATMTHSEVSLRSGCLRFIIV